MPSKTQVPQVVRRSVRMKGGGAYSGGDAIIDCILPRHKFNGPQLISEAVDLTRPGDEPHFSQVMLDCICLVKTWT